MQTLKSIFHQYHSANLLDKLLEEFSKAGWAIEKKESNFFHQFQWCDVVLSDKKIKIEKTKEDYSRDIEYLGCYECENKNWANEGKVYLFVDTIHEVANEYLKEKKSEITFQNLQKAIDDLATIVLIHEFVHWIIHWIESPKISNNKFLSRKFIPLKYDEDNEINFHECFAQLFTYLMIENNEDLKAMFDWLAKKQSEPYKKYEHLLENKIKNFKQAILLLTFLREIACQSYEAVEELISYIGDFEGFEKIKGSKVEEKKLENFWDFSVAYFELLNDKESAEKILNKQRGRIKSITYNL